ncbi:MAG TPA: VIT1/CCC1 transporter family protein [Ktedonobacterales bacterium]|nr:VIT1/CCC1 transporter family protein [Ktedonobacterales bacterium]
MTSAHVTGDGAQSPDPNASQQATQEHGTALYGEKTRIERLGRVRELVFGSLDGLLVPLGVISGVAGGTGHAQTVIIAGLAEAFAGALSMGAGEFISGRSEAQVHLTEIERERQEMASNPQGEREEMALLLQHEGMALEDARQVVTILERYPNAYTKTMIEKELGLQSDVETVKIPEALTIGISYIVGSIFPLIAYFFFPVTVALPISIGLTIVALVIVGVIKGKLASLNLPISILEVVVVGVVSAGGGYLLGTIIPRLFGY